MFVPFRVDVSLHLHRNDGHSPEVLPFPLSGIADFTLNQAARFVCGSCVATFGSVLQADLNHQLWLVVSFELLCALVVKFYDQANHGRILLLPRGYRRARLHVGFKKLTEVC